MAVFNTVRPAPTTRAHPQAISAYGYRQRDTGLLNAFAVECLVADANVYIWHIRAEHGAYLRGMAGLDADGGLRIICAALWLMSFVDSRCDEWRRDETQRQGENKTVVDKQHYC